MRGIWRIDPRQENVLRHDDEQGQVIDEADWEERVLDGDDK